MQSDGASTVSQIASVGASVETIVVGSSTTTSVVATVSVEAIDVSDELEESSPPHAVSASMPKIEIAAPKRTNECETCRDVIEDPLLVQSEYKDPPRSSWTVFMGIMGGASKLRDTVT